MEVFGCGEERSRRTAAIMKAAFGAIMSKDTDPDAPRVRATSSPAHHPAGPPPFNDNATNEVKCIKIWLLGAELAAFPLHAGPARSSRAPHSLSSPQKIIPKAHP